MKAVTATAILPEPGTSSAAPSTISSGAIERRSNARLEDYIAAEDLPRVSRCTADGEMEVFSQFSAERLDWIFACMLGASWILAIVAGWQGANHTFSDRFQTTFFLSALLVTLPGALVIFRPGHAWNGPLIGIAMAALSILVSYSAAVPGFIGMAARNCAGFVPVALFSFYPGPKALLVTAGAFCMVDFVWAFELAPLVSGMSAGTCIGHALFLAVEAAGLTALNSRYRGWLRQLLDRQFRPPPPREDPLTRLPLRAEAVSRLEQILSISETTTAVIAVDIDQLKHINQTLGIEAGDAVLCQAAQRFAQCLRVSDVLARIGKDEFVAILPNLGDVVQAEVVVRRLIDVLELPFEHEGRIVFATASLGLALAPDHASGAEQLLKKAEEAVAAAKRHGRGNFQIYEKGLAAPRASREGLEQDLHQALEQGQFQLHYQPQVNESGRILCLEALLRWRHPKHGLVPPSEFIPLAEANGLILPIGEWVLGEACRQGVRWMRDGLPPVRIAVNVSSVQFARRQLIDQVVLAIASSGFDARLLELEITESSLMIDHVDACEKIARLQALGVHISIDDFGMGYSSLAYLQQLPVNALKIDRNFVSGIETAASALPLLAAIIMLAHSLNLEVVVEGVETNAQREVVWSLGADTAQGYFFARPQAAADVSNLLRVARLVGPVAA